jgi:hypothetical protein
LQETCNVQQQQKKTTIGAAFKAWHSHGCLGQHSHCSSYTDQQQLCKTPAAKHRYPCHQYFLKL